MNRSFLLAFLLAVACALPAQAQRMPVTTDSDAARQHYVRGVHATSYVNFNQARTHFDAALAADPDFAMAHL